MSDSVILNDRILRSSGLTAGALAFLLGTIILVINMLGSSEIPIVEGQFERLYELNLISRIELSRKGLRCQLVHPVWVENAARRILTDKVLFEHVGEVSRDLVEIWTANGIKFMDNSEQPEAKEVWGILLIVFLLSIGIWYLWLQIKQDRQGGGSPRRRLHQLDEDLQTGKINEEEYHKIAASIMAEM